MLDQHVSTTLYMKQGMRTVHVGPAVFVAQFIKKNDSMAL